MSQSKLTEYFNTRKRAADSIDGNVSKKLKIVNEDLISQSHVATRSSSKAAPRTTRTTRTKVSAKSASKSIKVSAKVVCDTVEKTAFVDKFENVKLPDQNAFSLAECKTKEKSVVSKNLFPDVERKTASTTTALPGREVKHPTPTTKFPSIILDEEKKRSLREGLKSSNLVELRQKLSELHGMSSPMKQPGLLSSVKSSLMSLKSPLKVNPIGSPTKFNPIASPVKRFNFSTPTKSASPFKRQTEISAARELIASPTKMLQGILTSPTKAAQRARRELYPAAPTLVLPPSYAFLQGLFSSVDLIVSMLTNRHEICTFDKLKKAVEQMTKRDFTLKHLEQIKYVYPLAYNFRQETGLPCFGQGRSTDYQLTIEANIDEDDLSKPVSPMKSSLKFTPAKITDRKATFRSKLLNIVKKHHEEFLKNLAVPIDLDGDKLTQWHPQFPLDRLPEIPPSGLPVPPSSSNKLLNAQDFLLHAPKNMDARVKAALQTTAAKKPLEENKVVMTTTTTSMTAATIEPPKPQMKGISSSLLERVKAKEAEKLAKMMTESPVESKRRVMIDRLPEIARTLYHAFTTRKRPAISLDETIKALCASPTCYLSTIEMEKHLELMCELLPEWLTVAKISSGTYIKLMKSAEIGGVLAKLEELAKAKA